MSLRTKLVAVVVVLSALALLLSGFAATTALRGYLIDRADHQVPGAPPQRDFRLEEAQDTLNRLVLIEVIGGVAVLLLLGLVAWVVVTRALRPLVVVERTAEAIAAGDLSRRVPSSDPRTEIGSLSQSFNAMLAQIEAAFGARAASESEARASEERMRRFVGDASHELRTPLTSIRGFAELYRSGALATQAEVARAMARIESEAQRMGVLVEDLLLLARLDQQRPLEELPVDLCAVVAGAVHGARACDPARRISLSARGALVSGDESRLTQVVTNLLSNALTHTAAPIEVSVLVVGSDCVVEVADSGPGIPVAERTQVFERFFRADASRTRASGGAGLGLSIVAALVAAHGGTVTVSETPGGGATFRVRLPLLVTAPAPRPLVPV